MPLSRGRPIVQVQGDAGGWGRCGAVRVARPVEPGEAQPKFHGELTAKKAMPGVQFAGTVFRVRRGHRRSSLRRSSRAAGFGNVARATFIVNRE